MNCFSLPITFTIKFLSFLEKVQRCWENHCRIIIIKATEFQFSFSSPFAIGDVHTVVPSASYCKLTTASIWMEDRCPWCLGASTEISQPLDSETLPWLAIPPTQPWTPTPSRRDLGADGRKPRAWGARGWKRKLESWVRIRGWPFSWKKRGPGAGPQRCR